MEKQAHTPGPWDLDGYTVTADAGNPAQPIATIEQFLPEFRAESAANARLIAAAPELLAALKEVMDYQGGAESPLQDEYVVDRIRAAIARAEPR